MPVSDMPRAKISLDPSMIRKVGRDTYAAKPLLILIRELVQNARDATLRKGAAPNLTLEIRIVFDGDGCRPIVICQDNGTGMTPEDVLTKFLRIGAGKGSCPSPEVNPNETGYFGMAKVVLMSCEYWTCRTLDLLVTNRHVEEEREITLMQRRLAGTRICAGLEKEPYGMSVVSALGQALDYLTLSSVKVHVIVKTLHISEGIVQEVKTVLDRNFLGVDHIAKIIDSQSQNGAPGYIVRTVREMTEQEDFHVFNFIVRRCKKKSIFVRLNGLVQFSLYSEVDFKDIYVLIDVINCPNNLPPDSYPFSMSRESFKAAFSRSLESVIKSYSTNPLTVQNASARDYQTRHHVIGGPMLYGVHKPCLQENRLPNAFESVPCVIENSLPMQVERASFGDTNPIDVKILLELLTDKDIKPHWWRLLAAWGEILRLLHSDDDPFGIGFTGDEHTRAARTTYEREVFYLVNPNAVSTRTLAGKILSLWHLAAHEVCHTQEPYHNEYFTSHEGSLANATADILGRSMPHLAKLLQGRSSPSWLNVAPPMKASIQRSFFCVQ